MIKFVKNRKYSYALSIILFVIAVVSLSLWGLKLGLDFTGGSLWEIRFEGQRPGTNAVSDVLGKYDLGEIKIQSAGDQDYIIRFKEINEDKHQEIRTEMEKTFPAENGSALKEQRFESVGPVIGKELRSKAFLAIALASLMIVLYLAYAFRKVSKPVASWKYGVAAIIALIHDIIIVTGLFSILGHFLNMEVDSLFITALLTILGFSVHDTIVVFDRIRENLAKHYSNDFEETFDKSINQTLTRSINTSLTTLIVLVTMYIFGGRSISNFVLALIVGISIGTYSSIFVASPILIDWHRLGRKWKN
ncbi:MAG: protein translocase subunit SecF [Patescibacteria group bacterium]